MIMKTISLTFFLSVLVLAQSLEAQDVPTVPTYPSDFVGGAEVETIDGTQGAGTASVIKLKDGFQCYVVSARHLLGPMGGFKTQTAAKDVPSFVKSIKIDAFSGGIHTYVVTGLAVPATDLNPLTAPINDLAVYQLHDSSPQDQAVVLSDKLPIVGEPVWVVAKVRGGVPEGQIMQSAKVTSSKEGEWLNAQFDNDKIITAGASGAPVLNAAGEVVGVYSGHYGKDGHMFADIIPSTMIILIIKQANPSP